MDRLTHPIEIVDITEVENDHTRATILKNPTAMVHQEVDIRRETIHTTEGMVHDHMKECHPICATETKATVGIHKGIIKADRTSIIHNLVILRAEGILTMIHEATTMAMDLKIEDIILRCDEVSLLTLLCDEASLLTLQCDKAGLLILKEGLTTCHHTIITVVRVDITIDLHSDIRWEICQVMETTIPTTMVWVIP